MMLTCHTFTCWTDAHEQLLATHEHVGLMLMSNLKP